MDVFRLRNHLTEDYAAYASSFIQIRDEHIYREVHDNLNSGIFWPDPLIQLNPTFEDGGIVEGLVKVGLFHRWQGGCPWPFTTLLRHCRVAVGPLPLP